MGLAQWDQKHKEKLGCPNTQRQSDLSVKRKHRSPLASMSLQKCRIRIWVMLCFQLSPFLLWSRDNMDICEFPSGGVTDREWRPDTQRNHPDSQRQRGGSRQRQRGSSTLVFTAGFSSAIHPRLIFFTSHLPFSAINVLNTAGGKLHVCSHGAQNSRSRRYACPPPPSHHHDDVPSRQAKAKKTSLPF